MVILVMELDLIEDKFFISNGGFGQNVLIFGVYMGFSTHIDNKKKDINYWKRTNTRIRTYFNCRKNVSD